MPRSCRVHYHFVLLIITYHTERYHIFLSAINFATTTLECLDNYAMRAKSRWHFFLFFFFFSSGMTENEFAVKLKSSNRLILISPKFLQFPAPPLPSPLPPPPAPIFPKGETSYSARREIQFNFHRALPANGPVREH